MQSMSRRYTVTIPAVDPSWSTTVEAETRAQALTAGVKAYQEKLNSKLPHGFLYPLMKTKVVENRKLGPRPVRYVNLDYLSKEDEQWFVGFWEGDGWIGSVNKRLRLELYQKSPQVLVHIRKLLRLEPPIWKDQNGVHRITIASAAYVAPLISLLKKYVVSPYRAKRLSKLLQAKVTTHPPTWPWLAGFYDAEGCCTYSNGTLKLEIGQKHPEAPKKIRAFTSSGSLYHNRNGSHTVAWYGKQAEEVLRSLDSYLRNQEAISRIRSVLAFFKFKKDRR